MPNALAVLPDISKAKFPLSYEVARKALVKCESIDECKTWADKMKAMASYAKQSNDMSLEKAATRIRARAIKRCGQLLSEFEKKQGKRTDKKQLGVLGTPSVTSRKDVARAAGMNASQQKTALRVANVPEDVFEEKVESDDPPTVTELAKMGARTKLKPLVDLEGRDPKEFAVSTQVQGRIRDLAELMSEVSAEVVMRGAYDYERVKMREHLRVISEWAVSAVWDDAPTRASKKGQAKR